MSLSPPAFISHPTILKSAQNLTQSQSKYEGGYYLLNTDLVRTGLHTHTRALEAPVSDCTLHALNAIQRTPWKINGWLLDVMTEAYRSGSKLGGLPYADTVDLPKKSTEEWEAMTEEERNKWKFHLSSIHGHNARMESRRKALLTQIDIAETMRNQPAIWFPHFLDFRTRFYPMPQGLHPQCDDFGKALLEFAEGVELGKRGLFWLCIRAANCFGEDKMSLAARVKWVEEHRVQIIDSAVDPLDGGRFWAEADEPWGFLATCRELHEAWSLVDPTTYVSHQPVPQDGSCNGLQHLSAMGRDPIGARATNVAANKVRQDIYTQVATVVERLVSEDAVAGVALAHEWIGKITRKVVKRAVMTTPYGVTERGIAEQLMNDGHTEGMDKKGQAATYLKDKIVAALDETITSAKGVMAWLQATAMALAEAEKPFDFTTPTGNKVRQSYYTLNRLRLNTIAGKLVLWEEDRTGGLQGRKQMLAAAPNLIHSFDAAHLTMTVNAMAERLGPNVSFAMIHDSFGVHAARVDDLSRCLREQFVVMYQQDWLEILQAEFNAQAEGLAEVPHYSEFIVPGDFDVSECLDSEFFFA
ncbi:DNA-directed RNA polymerase [Devosia enhydra]|uniref:DNA-directed RNA polymerase n=1 Tax=Devosia enhydra TaxID=665118 RepID=A0A1K2HVD3_9HYPH|nr:DNA-directed RNA polymerase [Devosia enhydra]SFZ81709.1 DNA-directed RNA polymerase [Devosia enhydra]